MSEQIFIDVEDGIKRVMNNSSLFVKLLVKFKNDTNLEQIETALAAGDLEKAKNSAHTLKGLAANLSLMELNKQCKEIEAQIKAADVNPDKINIVKNVYSQTMAEIDKVIEQYGK